MTLRDLFWFCAVSLILLTLFFMTPYAASVPRYAVYGILAGAVVIICLLRYRKDRRR